jgi:hypothetical protein
MNSEGVSGRRGAGRPEKTDGRRDREELFPSLVRPSENQEKPYDFLFWKNMYLDARLRYARDQ